MTDKKLLHNSAFRCLRNEIRTQTVTQKSSEVFNQETGYVPHQNKPQNTQWVSFRHQRHADTDCKYA